MHMEMAGTRARLSVAREQPGDAAVHALSRRVPTRAQVGDKQVARAVGGQLRVRPGDGQVLQRHLARGQPPKRGLLAGPLHLQHQVA